MTIWIVSEDGIITEDNYDNIANLEAWQREMNEIYGDMWFEDEREAYEQASACINIELNNARFDNYFGANLRVSENLLDFGKIDISPDDNVPLFNEYVY